MITVSLSWVPAEHCENVPDTRMLVSFVKSAYILRGCVLTIRDVDLKNRFIIEPAKYGRRCQRLFGTTILGHVVRKGKVFLGLGQCERGRWDMRCKRTTVA